MTRDDQQGLDDILAEPGAMSGHLDRVQLSDANDVARNHNGRIGETRTLPARHRRVPQV
jgi:hypothetical protein